MLGKGGVPMSPTGAPNAPPSFDPNAKVPLDRQGNYVSPAASTLHRPRNLAGNVVLRGPGAEPVAVQPQIVGYRSSAASWSRDMDAWELAKLLDLAFRNPGDLGAGFAVEVSVEEYGRMEGNLRRHFMAVRE